MNRLVVPAGVGMVAVSFGLARYGYGLLLPDMRADLDIAPGTAGLVGSSAYVTYLLANTAVVPLTARSGPRLPLALATATAVGGMLTLAGAGDAVGLTAGVLLAGASAGFAFPPYADVVAVVVTPERRATAWAAVSSGTGWGVAVAGPVVVLSGAGWRTAWCILAGIGLVVGAAAVLSAPGGQVRTTQHPVSLRLRWFLCRASGPLLASAVLVGLGSSVWWAFSVDAMRAFGVDADAARLAYALCGAAGVVATLAGPLVGRVGQRAVHGGSIVALAGSLGLLASVQVATGPASAAVLLAGSAAVLFGVSYNGVIAVQGMWSTQVFGDRPSAGLAAVSTGLTLGTLAGPALGGWLIAVAGYPVALASAGVVAALAAPLAPPRAGHRRPGEDGTERHAVRTGV